jgi:hypothetical protein
MNRITRRRTTVAITLLAAALALPACAGHASSPSRRSAAAALMPVLRLPAPKDTLAATAPQPNGTMWVLAGSQASRGLFKLSATTGHVLGSVSVSNAARSVTESQAGVVGIALGTDKSGALELLDGRTGDAIRTVPLPAPAREVVAGSDGTTFYVLTGRTTSSSVTIVNSGSGRVHGTVPVPLNTVSVAPDVQQSSLYVLQRDGHISEIGITGGEVIANFVVGDSGQSLVLSPDGSTLYALKGTQGAANVAMVSVARESVRRVLPAPSHCLEVVVSASGARLYDVVGTAEYGDIQEFAV